MAQSDRKIALCCQISRESVPTFSKSYADATAAVWLLIQVECRLSFGCYDRFDSLSMDCRQRSAQRRAGDRSKSVWSIDWRRRVSDKDGTRHAPLNFRSTARFPCRRVDFSVSPRLVGVAAPRSCPPSKWINILNLFHVGRCDIDKFRPARTLFVLSTPSSAAVFVAAEGSIYRRQKPAFY